MATQDCTAMLMDNAVPDGLNGLAGLVGFLLMQCMLPEGTRSHLKAFQHFFFMQVLVDICGVGIHMHSYYRCLGVPMEGEFWTGDAGSALTYRTLMSAGLSFFSSSANLCLVLAVCDSKLSYVSKFPLVFFSVFYLTYFFSSVGPIIIGKPTTWLKSQFPIEMMTFGMWLPSSAWGVAYRWQTLDVGQSLPLAVMLLQTPMQALISPHYTLFASTCLLILAVPVYAMIYGSSRKIGALDMR